MKKYHYVYRIKNIKENKHYYGSRTSINVPKEDLGVIYYSSSSDKDFINDQKINKENYKYIIVRCFNNRKDSILFEMYLHNKFDVAKNEKFYNKSHQTSTGFLYGMLGKKQPKKTRNIAAIKAAETMNKIKENGLTIRQTAILKKVNTMKNNINENGETAYNVAAKKGDITKRNTILENGLNIYQNASNKWKENLDIIHNGEIMTTRDKLKKPKKDKSNYIQEFDKINIFDNNDKLIYEVNIPLEQFCNINNLPYTAFYKSKKYHITLYDTLIRPQTISILINKDYYKYKGWYARKRN